MTMQPNDRPTQPIWATRDRTSQLPVEPPADDLGIYTMQRSAPRHANFSTAPRLSTWVGGILTAALLAAPTGALWGVARLASQPSTPSLSPSASPASDTAHTHISVIPAGLQARDEKPEIAAVADGDQPITPGAFCTTEFDRGYSEANREYMCNSVGGHLRWTALDEDLPTEPTSTPSVTPVVTETPTPTPTIPTTDNGAIIVSGPTAVPVKVVPRTSTTTRTTTTTNDYVAPPPAPVTTTTTTTTEPEVKVQIQLPAAPSPSN